MQCEDNLCTYKDWGEFDKLYRVPKLNEIRIRQEGETQANNYKAMWKVMTVKGDVYRVKQSTFITSFQVPGTGLNRHMHHLI